MNSISKIATKVPKGFKHEEGQNCCKVGKNIYILGGLNPSHLGRFVRFNVDDMTVYCHSCVNKIPNRTGHACCFYSKYFIYYR